MGSMSRKIGLTYYPRDSGLTPMHWILNQVALTAKGKISATCISPISKAFTNNMISITDSRGKQKTKSKTEQKKAVHWPDLIVYRTE